MKNKRDNQVTLSLGGFGLEQEFAEFSTLLSDVGLVAVKPPPRKLKRGGGGFALLIFLSGGILAGFLSKLGEAMYEGLRAGIKRILLSAPRASVHIVGKNIREDLPEIDYICEFSSERDLDLFFGAVGQLHTLLTTHPLTAQKRDPRSIVQLDAYMRTEGDAQRYTTMRVDAYGHLQKTTEPLPAPPYWILEAQVGSGLRIERYLTIVPSRPVPSQAVLWRRWRG